MHMPLDSSVLVLAMDDRIWLDSETLISYLREIESQAQHHMQAAQTREDQSTAVAAYSSGEVVRQIADSLVLTTMVAGDRIKEKRDSRR